MDNPKFTYSNLRTIREELGLSAYEVAQKAGIPLTSLRRIEQGYITNPGINTIVKIANALDIPFNRVFLP